MVTMLKGICRSNKETEMSLLCPYPKVAMMLWKADSGSPNTAPEHSTGPLQSSTRTDESPAPVKE